MYNVDDLLTELKTFHGNREVKVALHTEIRGEVEIQKIPITGIKREDEDVILEIDDE